jgi:hypothetical protein
MTRKGKRKAYSSGLPEKKNVEIFGSFRNIIYLCSIQIEVVLIRSGYSSNNIENRDRSFANGGPQKA